jgi:hypothetical protein
VVRTPEAVPASFGNQCDELVRFFSSGAIGTLTFGTYSPTLKLSINNFLEGNVLRFVGSDLSSQINTVSLFDFDNGFIYDWNVTSANTFTITAIPEPSTVLAALGLGGLMLWPARRRLFRVATGTRAS